MANFGWAMEHMERGGAVRRAEWALGSRLTVKDGRFVFLGEAAAPWHPAEVAILAEDWEDAAIAPPAPEVVAAYQRFAGAALFCGFTAVSFKPDRDKDKGSVWRVTAERKGGAAAGAQGFSVVATEASTIDRATSVLTAVGAWQPVEAYQKGLAAALAPVTA